MNDLSWKEFERIELRVGTILSAEIFKEARTPAIKLSIDFGNDIGVRKSSAQITNHYLPEELIGKQISAVVNFPKKQIANFMSECLILGVVNDKGVVLLRPDSKVDNGLKIS